MCAHYDTVQLLDVTCHIAMHGKVSRTSGPLRSLGQASSRLHTSLEQHLRVLPADPVRAKAAKDYNRRTSSGNWIEDRVTAKEQITYKKLMGYL